MASKDFGLGAIVSLKDQFSSKASVVEKSLLSLESRFGVSSTAITKSMKNIAVGTGLLVAGGLLAGALSPHIEASKNYQNSLAEVGTLTDQTVGQMGELSSELIRQSTALGQLPIDSTKLLYQTISNGATEARDRMMLMQTAQKAAVAGLAKQNDTLQLLSAGVKAYGLSWDKSEAVSDKAFATVKLGVTTMSELAKQMQKVFAPAAALSVPMDQLFGAMATLTGVTGNTAEVSTQLRGILAAMIKPTSETQKEAEKLGITWGAQAVKTKGLVGVLSELRQKIGEDTQALSKFFPEVEGLTAAIALSGKQFDSFVTKTGQVRDATGATESAFRKMSATMQFQENRAAALNQALSITFGTPFLDALSPIVGMLNSMKQSIVDISQEFPAIPKAAALLAGSTAVILTLAGALFTLKGVMILIKKSWPLILKGMSVGLGKVAAMALPLLGVATALGALFLVLNKGNGESTSAFANIWEKGKAVWGGLSELITTFDGKTGKMSKGMAEKLKKMGLLKFTGKLFAMWARGRAFFLGIGEGFSQMATAIGEGIRSLLPEGSALQILFDSIADSIASLGLSSSIEDWKSYGKTIGAVLPFVFLFVGTMKIVGVVFPIVTGMVSAFTTAIGFARYALNLFMTTGPKAVAALWKFSAPILAIGALLLWIGARWEAFVESFKSEGIAGPLKIMLADFVSFALEFQKMIQKIPGIGKSIISDEDIKITRSFRDSLLATKGDAASGKPKRFKTIGEELADLKAQFTSAATPDIIPRVETAPGVVLPDVSPARRDAGPGFPSEAALQRAMTNAIANAPSRPGPPIRIELDGRIVGELLEERARQESLRSRD